MTSIHFIQAEQLIYQVGFSDVLYNPTLIQNKRKEQKCLKIKKDELFTTWHFVVIKHLCQAGIS